MKVSPNSISIFRFSQLSHVLTNHRYSIINISMFCTHVRELRESKSKFNCEQEDDKCLQT